MARFPTGLERELGGSGTAVVSGFIETWEETAELQWPNSVIVYDRMRRTDGQTSAVLRAIRLPIQRNRWRLVGDDVRPEVREFVEQDLGLTDDARGRNRRRRQGIVWDEFLRHALLHVSLGFMAFEQVYEVSDAGPTLVDRLPGQFAHLRKLAPRLPRTIYHFEVAPDGGLGALIQFVPRDDGRFEEVRLPVERLVMFVNDQEGGDWTGNSILRSSYKHWLIKDGLLRLGPMIVERNGMGLPLVHYPASGDKATALAMGRAARAGEDAAMAIPEGYEFELVGVTGSTRDELPLVKYHDEAIGRNALAMLLDLGHDRGARSLGETFADFFMLALNAIQDYVAEVITEHVIRDLVVLNFGQDEPYPVLKADDLTMAPELTADSLKALADARIIIPDEALEDDVRRRYRLPARPGAAQGPPDESIDGITEVPGGDPNEPTPTPTPPGNGPEPTPASRRPAAVVGSIEDLEQRMEDAMARLATYRERAERRA